MSHPKRTTKPPAEPETAVAVPDPQIIAKTDDGQVVTAPIPDLSTMTPEAVRQLATGGFQTIAVGMVRTALDGWLQGRALAWLRTHDETIQEGSAEHGWQAYVAKHWGATKFRTVQRLVAFFRRFPMSADGTVDVSGEKYSRAAISWSGDKLPPDTAPPHWDFPLPSKSPEATTADNLRVVPPTATDLKSEATVKEADDDDDDEPYDETLPPMDVPQRVGQPLFTLSDTVKLCIPLVLDAENLNRPLPAWVRALPKGTAVMVIVSGKRS